MIKQYDQQYKLLVISFVSYEESELFLDNCGRVYITWVDSMKLNELPKSLYCYPVDDRYKRSCGDDNGHNTNSIDALVNISACPNPEIVEWMKNARSSQQDHCDRLADKDSFSSEGYDYLKAKIAFSLFGSPCYLNEDDDEVKISSHNEGEGKCTNLIFHWLSAKSSSEINIACIFLMIKQYDQEYVIKFVSNEKSELF